MRITICNLSPFAPMLEEDDFGTFALPTWYLSTEFRAPFLISIATYVHCIRCRCADTYLRTHMDGAAR